MALISEAAWWVEELSHKFLLLAHVLRELLMTSFVPGTTTAKAAEGLPWVGEDWRRHHVLVPNSAQNVAQESDSALNATALVKAVILQRPTQCLTGPSSKCHWLPGTCLWEFRITHWANCSTPEILPCFKTLGGRTLSFKISNFIAVIPIFRKMIGKLGGKIHELLYYFVRPIHSTFSDFIHT